MHADIDVHSLPGVPRLLEPSGAGRSLQLFMPLQASGGLSSVKLADYPGLLQKCPAAFGTVVGSRAAALVKLLLSSCNCRGLPVAMSM